LDALVSPAPNAAGGVCLLGKCASAIAFVGILAGDPALGDPSTPIAQRTPR
jgi:hypothetical protein